ncbi:hypothetical protein FRC08_003035, partial [Ceratobasidium sp. 394]
GLPRLGRGGLDLIHLLTNPPQCLSRNRSCGGECDINRKDSASRTPTLSLEARPTSLTARINHIRSLIMMYMKDTSSNGTCLYTLPECGEMASHMPSGYPTPTCLSLAVGLDSFGLVVRTTPKGFDFASMCTVMSQLKRASCMRSANNALPHSTARNPPV